MTVRVLYWRYLAISRALYMFWLRDHSRAVSVISLRAVRHMDVHLPVGHFTLGLSVRQLSSPPVRQKSHSEMLKKIEGLGKSAEGAQYT